MSPRDAEYVHIVVVVEEQTYLHLEMVYSKYFTGGVSS